MTTPPAARPEADQAQDAAGYAATELLDAADAEYGDWATSGKTASSILHRRIAAALRAQAEQIARLGAIKWGCFECGNEITGPLSPSGQLACPICGAHDVAPQAVIISMEEHWIEHFRADLKAAQDRAEAMRVAANAVLKCGVRTKLDSGEWVIAQTSSTTDSLLTAWRELQAALAAQPGAAQVREWE